jgi:hypothetical protein
MRRFGPFRFARTDWYWLVRIGRRFAVVVYPSGNPPP